MKRSLSNPLVGKIALAAAVFVVGLVLIDRILPEFVPVVKSTLIADPLLGFRGRPEVQTIWTREVPRPITVRLNQYGFHDVECSLEKAPGTFRIVSLGDSFVQALQVPIDKNFSKFLEDGLNRQAEKGSSGSAPSRIQVLNQGVQGYGLGVYYLYVTRRLERWKPDLLLLSIFLGNDLGDNYYETASPSVPRFRMNQDRLDFLPPPNTLGTWVRDNFFAHSNIALVLRNTIVADLAAESKVVRDLTLSGGIFSSPHLLDGVSQKQRDEMLSIASLQLHGIKAYLAARQVRLFILVIPDPYRVFDIADPVRRRRLGGMAVTAEDRQSFEQGVLAILESEGIPHIYPLARFVNDIHEQQEVYLRDVGHLSPYGHREIAEILEGPVWDLVQHKRDPRP